MRKARRVTGTKLLDIRSRIYHVADKRGRLYMCNCMRDPIDFGGGLRNLYNTHKRNSEFNF